MERMTDKQLNATILWINRLTQSPTEPYSKNEKGEWKPNANNYHLSGANGGKSLHRMSATEGCTGVSDVFNCGHIPKRELANRMYAFICGLEAHEK